MMSHFRCNRGRRIRRMNIEWMPLGHKKAVCCGDRTHHRHRDTPHGKHTLPRLLRMNQYILHKKAQSRRVYNRNTYTPTKPRP